MRKIILAVLLLPAVTAFADQGEPVPQRLFHIERNKNANIVVYDAMVLPDSNLAKKDPVDVYWLKLAEGGHRKGLKRIEKRMAYGFKVKDRDGNRLTLDMKADIGRPIFVEATEGTYQAFVDINGQRVVLDKVYIFAIEKMPLPSVQYLELFGHHPETGEKAYEKFEP